MRAVVRNLLLLTGVLCFCLQSAANIPPRAYFDQEVSGWSSPYLVIDGRLYSPSTLTQSFDITEALRSDASAAEFARLHEFHATRASLGLWTGLGLYLGIALATDPNEPGPRTASLAVLLGGLLYSGYQASVSQGYLYKAINTYNSTEGIPDEIIPDVSGPTLKTPFLLAWQF